MLIVVIRLRVTYCWLDYNEFIYEIIKLTYYDHI